jgi:hypothetical protein
MAGTTIRRNPPEITEAPHSPKRRFTFSVLHTLGGFVVVRIPDNSGMPLRLGAFYSRRAAQAFLKQVAS